MEIKEKCSCGASIKLNSPDAIRLVREWRKKHTCLEKPEDPRDSSLSIYTDKPDKVESDYPIGFRYEPEEDWEDRKK
jgi:hypothetical protein